MKTKLLSFCFFLVSFSLVSFSLESPAYSSEPGNSSIVLDGGNNLAFGTSLVDFTLVDADTDQDLYKFKEGVILNMDEFKGHKLNIRANIVENPSYVEFILEGPVSLKSREMTAPFALFGDNNGDYNGRNLPLGNYTLMAAAFALTGVGEDEGVHLNDITLHFSVGKETNEVIDFNFITDQTDFQLNQDYNFIVNGETYNANNYPFKNTPISIKAHTNSFHTGSIALTIAGPINYSLTENQEPFTLFGDNAINFIGRIFPLGKYTLTATPYSGKNKQGTKGIPLTITFYLADLASLTLDDTFIITNVASNDVFNNTRYLLDGDVIDQEDFSTDQANITVSSFNPELKSVYLSLAGPVADSRTENMEPYAVFGDINGSLNARSLPIGSYTLTGIPYTGENRSGKPGTTRIYNFEIVNTSTTLSNKLILSPNPATDAVTLTNNNSFTSSQTSIIDIYGNVVKIIPTTVSSKSSIDLTGLKKGIYFVRIEQENQNFTKKLIVQ